jgi:hypothetical protein
VRERMVSKLKEKMKNVTSMDNYVGIKNKETYATFIQHQK